MRRGLALAGAIAALVAAPSAAAEVHVTNSANAGAGSLRDVIAAAAPGETVVIDAGIDPIVAAPRIEIDKSLTIRGQGSSATTIGGAGGSRVFAIGTLTPGISVAIEDLAISGGTAPNGANGDAETFGPGGLPATAGKPGGGGGAIVNEADDLALVRVRLSNNAAGDGGAGGDAVLGMFPSGSGGAGGSGGAIYNSGTLTVVDSILTGNEAGVGGVAGFSMGGASFPGQAGVGGSGGAIYNVGAVSVANSTISGNDAGDGQVGGGNFLSFASPGAAGGNGGAIASAGALTLVGSTLSDNVAGTGGTGGSSTTFGSVGGPGGHGGALYVGGATEITNTTLVGNAAGAGGNGSSVGGPGPGGAGGAGGDGGAIAAGGASAVTVAAATVVGNAAGSGGSPGTGIPQGPPGTAGSGGGISSGSSSTVRASILTANAGAAANCGSGVVDGGGNLAFPDAGGCAGFPVGDPKLDPAGLASNGGPTQTIALLPGSAAVDAVPAGACVAADGAPLATDQRGVARPQGPACDAGAYERETQPSRPDPPAGSKGPKDMKQVPDTTLTKAPKKVVKTRKKRARVVIRFASTPPGADFECSLDRSTFKPCKSPQTYRLKPGKHEVAVRAVLGEVADESPATAKFRVIRLPKKPKHG